LPKPSDHSFFIKNSIVSERMIFSFDTKVAEWLVPNWINNDIDRFRIHKGVSLAPPRVMLLLQQFRNLGDNCIPRFFLLFTEGFQILDCIGGSAFAHKVLFENRNFSAEMVDITVLHSV
jgi:hypothetical protein